MVANIPDQTEQQIDKGLDQEKAEADSAATLALAATVKKEQFNKERDDAHESANKDQAEYDKQLITLSVGFLAILFAFIKDIVHLDAAVDRYALYSSIALLAVTVFSVLSSYQYAIWVNRRISYYFACRAEGDDGPEYPIIRARLIGGINLLSGVLFFLGVALACFFVIINLYKEANVDNRSPNQSSTSRIPDQTELIKKGLPPKVQAPSVVRPQATPQNSNQNNSAPVKGK